ncbi:hypothetical protein P8452_20522 [Trifolium repens]|nr:hypothetical protein P8452_20522 [Trifolium repens]
MHSSLPLQFERELKLTHVSGMEKAYINFLMRTRCEICAAPFKFGAGFLGSLAYTQMLGSSMDSRELQKLVIVKGEVQGMASRFIGIKLDIELDDE